MRATKQSPEETRLCLQQPRGISCQKRCAICKKLCTKQVFKCKYGFAALLSTFGSIGVFKATSTAVAPGPTHVLYARSRHQFPLPLLSCSCPPTILPFAAAHSSVHTRHPFASNAWFFSLMETCESCVPFALGTLIVSLWRGWRSWQQRALAQPRWEADGREPRATCFSLLMLYGYYCPGCLMQGRLFVAVLHVKTVTSQPVSTGRKRAGNQRGGFAFLTLELSKGAPWFFKLQPTKQVSTIKGPSAVLNAKSANPTILRVHSCSIKTIFSGRPTNQPTDRPTRGVGGC